METDYAKIGYQWTAHHQRWRARVEQRKPQLVCQECHGAGGETEPVLDDGSGPFIQCGWCEGIGLVDGSRRAEWLNSKRHTKILNFNS